MKYLKEIIIFVLIILIGIGSVLWYRQYTSLKKQILNYTVVSPPIQSKQNVDSEGHPIGIDSTLGFTSPPPLVFDKPIIWKNFVSKDRQIKFPYPDGATIIDNGDYIAVNFTDYGVVAIQKGTENIEPFLTNIQDDVANVQQWDLVDSMQNPLGTFYKEYNRDGSVSDYYLFDNGKQKVLVSDNGHDHGGIDDSLRYVSSYIINHLVIQ